MRSDSGRGGLGVRKYHYRVFQAEDALGLAPGGLILLGERGMLRFVLLGIQSQRTDMVFGAWPAAAERHTRRNRSGGETRKKKISGP